MTEEIYVKIPLQIIIRLSEVFGEIISNRNTISDKTLIRDIDEIVRNEENLIHEIQAERKSRP